MTDALKEKWSIQLKNAIWDEFNEHKSCHYEFGCIIESVTLGKRFKKIINQAIAQTREATLSEVKKSIQFLKPLKEEKDCNGAEDGLLVIRAVEKVIQSLKESK